MRRLVFLGLRIATPVALAIAFYAPVRIPFHLRLLEAARRFHANSVVPPTDLRDLDEPTGRALFVAARSELSVRYDLRGNRSPERIAAKMMTLADLTRRWKATRRQSVAIVAAWLATIALGVLGYSFLVSVRP